MPWRWTGEPATLGSSLWAKGGERPLPQPGLGCAEKRRREGPSVFTELEEKTGLMKCPQDPEEAGVMELSCSCTRSITQSGEVAIQCVIPPAGTNDLVTIETHKD